MRTPLFAAFIAAVALLLLPAPGHAAPAPPVFAIADARAQPYEPLVAVRTTGARPGSDVSIWLEDAKGRQTQVTTRADRAGNSQALITAGPGAHTVLAEAVWGGPGDQLLVMVAKPRTVVVSTAVVPFVPTLRRTVGVELMPKRIRAWATIELPRQDLRVIALLQGAMTPAAFIDAVLNCAALTAAGSPDHKTIAELIDHGATTVALHDSTVIVTVQGTTRSADESLLPTLKGKITFAVPTAACSATDWHTSGLPSSDELDVHVDGYVVGIIDPRTTDISGSGTYRWNDYGLRDGERVTIGLSFNPLSSPRNLRALAQLSIFSFIPPAFHWVASWLNVISGILLALPMLVFVAWNARRNPAGRASAGNIMWCAYVQGSIAVAPLIFQALTSGEAGLPVASAIQPFLEGFIAAFPLSVALFAVSRLPAGSRLLGTLRFVLACGATAAGTYCTVALIALAAGRASASEVRVLLWLVAALIVLVSLSSCVWKPWMPVRRPWVAFGLFLLAVLLACPLGTAAWASWAISLPVPDLLALTTEILNSASHCAPFLFALPFIISLVRNEIGGNWDERTHVTRWFFRLYAVPWAWQIAIIPVTLIVSVPLAGTLVPAFDETVLARVRRTLRLARRAVVERALAITELWQIGDVLKDVRSKFLQGDIGSNDYRARMAGIESYARVMLRPMQALGERTAAASALALGPYDSDIRNARLGLMVGIVFATIDAVVYLPPTILDQSIAFNPFPIAAVVSFMVTVMAQPLIAGFMFGYGYPLIWGESGIRKGLHAACFVSLCSLIYWTVTFPLAVAGVLFVQTFLFYTLLGALFDFASIRGALQERFKFQHLAQLSGIPSLTAVGAVVIGSLGVALRFLIAGHLREGIQVVVRALVGSG